MLCQDPISYQDRIAEYNNADLRDFVRWSAGGTAAGFVRHDRLHRLRASGAPFVESDQGFALCGNDVRGRSQQLHEWLLGLVREGEFEMSGEIYPVVQRLGEAPQLLVDRGAVPWLGVRPFGVHLCGFVRRGTRVSVWVAVRAKGKTFAGRWDNTVAGGQPVGLSLRENLIKECGEEASMPASLVQQAVATSTLTYVRADATGLKPDTLVCYDLELPHDFVPTPRDGEVERFLLVDSTELAAVVREEPRCKPNCSLVWIDFLLRHGLLDGPLSRTERESLARALRAPLP